MAGPIQVTNGFGRKQTTSETWFGPTTLLAESVATGATGPTAADLIDGSIYLTAMSNPVYSYLHIWVKTNNWTDGASARLVVWSKIPGTDDWTYETTLEVTKPFGQHFVLTPVAPTQYRIGLASITDGCSVDIWWARSE